MIRIVVIGQPGAFGSFSCRRAALQIARQLDLPCVAASELESHRDAADRWVATVTVGALSSAVLNRADTAVWLHYSPLAVVRAWMQERRNRRAQAKVASIPLRLADFAGSVLHFAWTARIHRLLVHPARADLRVFHLRSPKETDFWLRLLEHWPPAIQRPQLAQAA